MSKKTIRHIIHFCLILITFLSFSSIAADEQDQLYNNGQVYYSSHVQDIGWQDPVTGGQISGTVGQARQIEAIKISLPNNESGSIHYSTHIQDIGWQEEVSDGQISGTVGQAKQIEALRMYLSGEISDKYDIYYRVHVEDFGWLDWAKNGANAGTEGLFKQIEAYEVRLVAKNSPAPGNTQRTFIEFKPEVYYSSHVQDIGWQGFVSTGQISGTVGQAKQIEAIKLTLPNSESGSIYYSTHVQDIGWQGEVSDGEISGTVGQAKQVEALKMHLTGIVADRYDIYYRVHVEEYGWLDWAKNGENAGTEGLVKQVEAYEVRLVKKNSPAPGNTQRPFIKKVFKPNYNYNSYNAYPVGQCTWGAKALAPWASNFWGNGGQWAANARRDGFRVGTMPEVGAIACWTDSGYGHVAVVTHVQSQTRIQVKESNYAGNQFIANFRGWFNPTIGFGRVSYIYPD